MTTILRWTYSVGLSGVADPEFATEGTVTQVFLGGGDCSVFFPSKKKWQAKIYHWECLNPPDNSSQNKIKESPPAWTQEAYHPPCSEYSFCCPNWVPLPPILTWPGGGGTPPGPAGGVPWQGGYPAGRVPCWGGTLPPAAPWHSGKCCKALWDMGTPPQVWTN